MEIEVNKLEQVVESTPPFAFFSFKGQIMSQRARIQIVLRKR